MNVGSLLEIYTTMFGWSIYNAMFDLFRATGLILVPFIFMLVKNWKEPLQSQNDKAASVVSQSRVTIDSMAMVAVFMLAVVPILGLDVNEVRYRVACTDSSGGTDVYTDVVGSSTGTTYDASLAAINNVKIPVLWMLVLQVGSGVNAALSSSFLCFEDIKGLDQQLRNLTIKDQSLRREYFRFANECFLPAKSKYAEAMRGGNYHDYVEPLAESFIVTPSSVFASLPERDDFFYMGSYFYQQTPGFYKEFNVETCPASPGGCGFKARSGVFNWPINQARDRYPEKLINTPDPNNPLYGKPYCDEWWTDSNRGLRSKLLQSIEASTVYHEKNPADGWWESFIKTIKNAYASGAYTDQEIEDIIIKRYAAEDPPSFTPDKGGLIGNNDFADITFNSPLQNVENAALGLAGIGTAALAARGKFAAVKAGASKGSQSFALQLADFYTNMLIAKQAAPMVQAVLLMMIYMLLLIYFLMSDYDIEATIRVIFVILAFQFFTTIWNFADYLDARLFVSMYPDATLIGGFATYGPNRLILDVVLTILYVAAPFLLLWIMNMAGSKVGNLGPSLGGLGRSGQSSGTSRALSTGVNAKKG